MEPAIIQKIIKNSEQAALFETAYSVYMYSMFVASSFLTFITLYIFLNRHSKLHPELKVIAAHTIVTSYVMTATMTFWQVIVLPPFVGGYPQGWIFKKIGSFSFLLGLYICWRYLFSNYIKLESF